MEMLKVIGAGLPRTGTTSMKAALEQLGFGPCHHMIEVFKNPEKQTERWQHVITANPVDWNWVFEGYQAVVDFPGSYFWRQLAETYPNAKVLLTVRDPHRWYASVRDTIFSVASKVVPGIPGIPDLRSVFEFIWKGTLGVKQGEEMPDEEHAVQVFEQHIADVKASIPADRLLVFEASQGWKPLCDFLGVEVPADAPFPHLNEGKLFRNVLQQVKAGQPVTLPFGITLPTGE